MKRKYPMYFFIMGIIQNLVKYVFIGLIGVIFLIVGLFGPDICKTIGSIILTVYFLICVIEQFFIRSAILKESDNPEFNELMDETFGINNNDQNDLSAQQKIIKSVEERIKSQDENLDK